MVANFRGKFPITMELANKKRQFMQSFLSGNFSPAQQEEMYWRNLEKKVAQNSMKLINVPYEKARLHNEIENFEQKLSKNLVLTKNFRDPTLQNLRLKQ